VSVKIGLKSVYYALLDDDDVTTGVTYATPVSLIGAITANVNPNSSKETLFADDGPMVVATTLGEVELELNMADLSLAAQAILLGHDTPVSGVLTRHADDVPPWLALGWKSLKANGSYRYFWLVKGKFMVPEEANETKADSITFSTPTITGGFVKRDYDDVYKIEADADEDYEGGDDGWFTTDQLDAIAAS
jgi:phi13 family phage major tail protein